MDQLKEIRLLLDQVPKRSGGAQGTFFKTGAGHYAEHDQFIGVSMPALRIIAKEYKDLSLPELENLIISPINEERQLALLLLVSQYKRAKEVEKNRFYDFYMNHLKYVNNWNLVDSSAQYILGPHIEMAKREILVTLATSKNMWHRRIAIVATHHFIRKNDLAWTFKLAALLLNDRHDLIHKATGWMLREAGKKDLRQLIAFLDLHACRMPRTMLRYAIEKFPEQQRKNILRIKANS